MRRQWWSLLGLSVLGLASLGTAGCGPNRVERSRDGTIEAPYFAIQETLASDSLDALPQLGAILVEVTAAHAAEPGLDLVSRGAAKVGAMDIATARLAFRTMSEGLVTYLTAHPDHRANTMRVHCPMAFEGTGATWVQKVGPVMNPYEGAMMLHCGDEVPWE